MARLIVVSNRVRIPEIGLKTRPGGLEVALKAAVRGRESVWFGWSGKVCEGLSGDARTIDGKSISYVVVDLARKDRDEFYNGFANRVLWPILHYRLDLAEFSGRDLGGYLRVNDHFARSLSSMLRPNDVVWVHDYHLIPLAKSLREAGHENRIGFFLHVPLPPPEIVTALPNHERLIPTLAYYDLIGVQTDTDAANLSRYFSGECHFVQDADGGFTVGDRMVRVAAFPVGVETDAFARMARRAIKSDFVRGVLASLSGRALILGVDRLDYSKGIVQRLHAFDCFLATFPEWHRKITYLQITPHSRTDVPEYADMARAIEEIAGRLNGIYGEAAWTPIRYINRVYSRTALAGLYRAARVALVTPLRDGMNLVAKEFVAAQDRDDPGVLILSRFAGAARELEAALIVNPHDPEGMAAAISRALAMPLQERRERQDALWQALSRNDLQFWADRFLCALARKAAAPSWAMRLGTFMGRAMKGGPKSAHLVDATSERAHR